MKKSISCLLILVTAALLCGFESGIVFEETEPPETVGPVIEYEETIAPQKSNKELYQQYFLLAVTSLEEAQSALTDNPRWAYRMAHNAYNYMNLLSGLLVEEQKIPFDDLSGELNVVLAKIKRFNLNRSQVIRARDRIKDITAMLEADYDFKKAKIWIRK